MKSVSSGSACVLVMIVAFCTGHAAYAQGPAVDPGEIMEVSGKMSGYIMELTAISAAVDRAGVNELGRLEDMLESVSFRCGSYMDVEQLVITQDERLMNTMSMYRKMLSSVTDSLSAQRSRLKAVEEFDEARAYISSMTAAYEDLSSRAFKLSLTKHTAAELSKLKAGEQLEFKKVQQAFDKAVSAAAANGRLSGKMKELDGVYCDLKLESEKIQGMVFKPIKDRIKDYVMSLAAVSVILMFVSMLKSKISAAKAQKKALGKYKNLLKDDDYPTI